MTQDSYQVRFDWGVRGAEAVGADADAIVWVDQLGESAAPADAVRATLEHAGELGACALREQEALGGRFRIAVVAAGAARDGRSARRAGG